MKKYIKPITEMHAIELQSLIAATTNGPAVKNGSTDDKVTDPTDILGKETNISSTSLWDEEE